ncbi:MULTISPECIES: MarR family winged helix-turn-helix transcriptional regulator [Cetobacterium]|uniref:Transcriptional regulator, MarR family n=2 Tax=Cetobacterium TaxID=180162 RepID=U7VDN8_9FUSO|nr:MULTISPECIES: MarR family transcriptional regulator [Cetobacterium]ERT69827.1 transcriptional regulator, MarR family [Cetobacterium somerae ATCC BAA-474]
MNNINKVNDVLENFYKLFYETEDLALKRGIKCITHTELHIIEAIGKESLSMNELSDRLGITMGTATVAITKLREKGFIDRVRSDADRRKVYVSLSKKGIEALNYHNTYHKNIISTITENIPEKDLNHFTETFELILKNLKDKTEFFKPHSVTEFPVGTVVSINEVKGTPIIQDYFANNGIEHYSTVKIVESEEKDKVALEKEDGSILKVNLLDAKNLIAIKVEE